MTGCDLLSWALSPVCLLMLLGRNLGNSVPGFFAGKGCVGGGRHTNLHGFIKGHLSTSVITVFLTVQILAL